MVSQEGEDLEATDTQVLIIRPPKGPHFISLVEHQYLELRHPDVLMEILDAEEDLVIAYLLKHPRELQYV